jgi:di/tricarboxylate transporter
VEQLARSYNIRIRDAHDWKQDLSGGEIEFCELVVAPRSTVAGKTLKQLNFREKYDLSAVALWRENRSYRTDVGEIPLRFGDALLVLGNTSKIQLLQSEMDFIVLRPHLEPALNLGKSLVTIAVLLTAIIVSGMGILHVSEAMLIAALALILGKVVSMDEAYQAIEWRVVFVVAGLLPLGIAMTKSGLTTMVSQTMVGMIGSQSTLGLLAGFLLLAIIFTQFLSGQTTAIVLSPIAISTALKIGANPQAFAMAIAIGASTAFLTPISHSVNVLVMGVGGYRFRDFFRIGLPLTILVFFVVVLSLPLYFPLFP